jgi:hypothetical protein
MGGWCGRRDAAEEVAFRHLRARCAAGIVYEPDGNVPPDFLVDGRIAVEVRRLNRNESGSDRPVGLERSATPLVHRLQTLLASAGASGDAAWWVGLEFRRPIPPWETLAPAVRNLRLCIAEKTAKVARYRSRYPEWWLLLVDVAFGLDRQVGLRIPCDVWIGHGWDRVIILDPTAPASSVDFRRT